MLPMNCSGKASRLRKSDGSFKYQTLPQSSMTKVTQKRINYRITNIDGDGATASIINSFRDLSALNRKHAEMTTRKGVPLVARYAVSAYGGIIDMSGSGGSTADLALSATADGLTTTSNIEADGSSPEAGEDFEISTTTTSKDDNVIVLRFFGTLNNWVYRNGAVKTHAAREKMFRKAMVKKGDRGAYDHTIHYGLASASESYLSPVHGTSTPPANITGGSWENSQLIYPSDTDGAYLVLSGSHSTEETNEGSRSYLVMPQLYLQSRHAEVPADSNVESGTNQAKYSVLNKLLTTDYQGTADEVVALARSEQDNPPYDLDDVGGDWSTLVEIGRLQFNANLGHAASTVIEVPFGITQVRAQVLNAGEHSTGNVSAEIDLSLQLLSVREMEG